MALWHMMLLMKLRLWLLSRTLATTHFTFLLDALLEMHFGVSLLLIRSCEFPTANITTEWLFTGMSANVCREMIGTWKWAHTNAALERFLTRMNTDVTCKFIRTRKSSITIFYWASIRPLMNGRFARTIWIFTRFYRHQFQWQWTLLVYLW